MMRRGKKKRAENREQRKEKRGSSTESGGEKWTIGRIAEGLKKAVAAIEWILDCRTGWSGF
jgi:hypothetical protein